MIGQSLDDIFVLSKTIGKYTTLLRSTFQPYYADWLKVLWYITQLSSMSLPSNRLILPHLEDISSTWRNLGDKFGYLDYDPIALTCSYARCPGFELVGCRGLTCSVCLSATYCSVRCQQA